MALNHQQPSGVPRPHLVTRVSLKAEISSNGIEPSTHCIVPNIEGTTTPISSMTDVLLPYVRHNVGKYLELTYDAEETQDDIKLLRAQLMISKNIIPRNITNSNQMKGRKLISTGMENCSTLPEGKSMVLTRSYFPKSGKKRCFSTSNNSGNGLEPVAKDLPWQHSDPHLARLDPHLARLSENGLTPEKEHLLATGSTPIQNHPSANQPLNQITDSIRM